MCDKLQTLWSKRIGVNTSFTGEGKLNSIASNPTECINDDVALTTTCDVSSNFFWCH